MASLDIDVSPELKELFKIPPCDVLSLPKPEPLSLTLPSGMSLKAISDISKGIPNDCSMVVSLLIQLAPLLASMECLLKILKLLAPLVEIIKGVTKVPPAPDPSEVAKFVEAGVDLVNTCVVKLFGGIPAFIRDILCLILKLLHCLLDQLKSVVAILTGNLLQIKLAEEEGNSDLVALLDCANKNALTSADHMAKAVEPITAILDLVGPLLGIAGLPEIKIPALGSATDLESLNEVILTLDTIVDILQQVVDGLGRLLVIRDVLGRGWKFPIRVAPSGGLPYSEGEQNVQESIWIVLATAVGERQMRPDYGCGLHEYVFSPVDPSTFGNLANQVRQALTRWEARIDVVEVRVEEGTEVGQLLICTDYRVRSTNSFHNVVYPFYVREGRRA